MPTIEQIIITKLSREYYANTISLIKRKEKWDTKVLRQIYLCSQKFLVGKMQVPIDVTLRKNDFLSIQFYIYFDFG